MLHDDYRDDETLTCLNEGPDCEGPVEYRMAMSATGKQFPRCDKHFEEAYARYEDIQRRYPVNAPSDFDESYAGEHWDEDY